MNLKKTYKVEPGFKEMVTAGESTLSLIDFGLLHLTNQGSEVFETGDKETALVVLSGQCAVKGSKWEWEEVGQRRSVFEGAAFGAFIPRRQRVEISTETKVTLAVIQAPTDRDSEPVLVRPEEVIAKPSGRSNWRRDAHFIIDERIPARYLFVGEGFIYPGNWSSYPPHRHEEDNLPDEGKLEELYFFRFNMEQGFGFQRVYTDDGEIDETYTVKNNDLVEIPRGYHPFVTAPGYFGYYLWVMAGKNRGYYWRMDPEHQWFSAVDKIISGS